MSKKTELLQLLKEKGDAGATSREIYDRTGAFRYGVSINLLRKEGHKIETKRVKGSLYKYTLSTEEEPKAVSWLNEDD